MKIEKYERPELEVIEIELEGSFADPTSVPVGKGDNTQGDEEEYDGWG